MELDDEKNSNNNFNPTTGHRWFCSLAIWYLIADSQTTMQWKCRRAKINEVFGMSLGKWVSWFKPISRFNFNCISLDLTWQTHLKNQ